MRAIPPVVKTTGISPTMSMKLTMSKIKMIATDIDGTLVDDAKNLSPKTIEVLKKARAYAKRWIIS